MTLAEHKEKGEIPAPTPLNEIEYRKGQIPVIVEIFMPPVRDRIKNRFVKKTLSLPARLAAQADDANVNCSKLFQNALVNYLDLQKARCWLGLNPR